MSHINLILQRIISIRFFRGLLLFVNIALMSVDLSSLTNTYLVTRLLLGSDILIRNRDMVFWWFCFFVDVIFRIETKHKNQD